MSDTSAAQARLPLPLERIVAWLKGHERAGLMVGVGFQLLVLLGTIAFRAMPHLTGETVLLRVVPVDPRDMFRGDYVVLGYELSRIPSGGIEGLGAIRYDQRDWQGTTVYASLTPEADGQHSRTEKFSIYQPSGGKYIRGTMANWGRIEYGIESYYVQEGEGAKYEQAVRSRQLSAEVWIAPDGRAALRSLRIE